MNYEIPSTNTQSYIQQEMYNNDRRREANARQIAKEYSDFVSNSKIYFVSEALNYFLQPCLESISYQGKEKGKLICEEFVKEEGADKLLSTMSKKSLILSGIAEACNSAHKQVIHGCDSTDPSTYKITKTISDKFFEKLDGMSDKNITKKINERVCKSVEDYVQSNVEDKENLDKLADETKEKIDNIKAKTTEQKDKIAQEFTMLYKKKVGEIKSHKNKAINIFEAMMSSATESALQDKALLEAYTNSDGKLDIEGIRENVTVMYTFLEMVNTLNIKSITPEYINKIVM